MSLSVTSLLLNYSIFVKNGSSLTFPSIVTIFAQLLTYRFISEPASNSSPIELQSFGKGYVVTYISNSNNNILQLVFSDPVGNISLVKLQTVFGLKVVSSLIFPSIVTLFCSSFSAADSLVSQPVTSISLNYSLWVKDMSSLISPSIVTVLFCCSF